MPYTITGPAMVNIFAAVPKIRPSVLNSTAGAAMALANPVMGTSVPAPARLAISSYKLSPVRSADSATSVMDAAVEDGQQNGYALTLMGRRRYLPELTASNAMVREFGKRAAMNTPVQGTAADIIKLAMVRVDEALRREKLQSRLILQVHDELLLECPPEEVETAARILQEAMEGVITLSVPLSAEVHQGANWAEAH